MKAASQVLVVLNILFCWQVHSATLVKVNELMKELIRYSEELHRKHKQIKGDTLTAGVPVHNEVTLFTYVPYNIAPGISVLVSDSHSFYVDQNTGSALRSDPVPDPGRVSNC